MRKLLVLLFLGVISNLVSAQNDTNLLEKYSPNFEFKEGLYLNFEQLKSNKPVAKSRVVTSLKLNDIAFFEKILDTEFITIYDDNGANKEIETEQIWGYCNNNKIHINYMGKYNFIPFFGAICHFIAYVTTTEHVRNNYANNYYRPVYPSSTESTEMKQFMLDLTTGKIYDFDVKSVEVLLMKDTLLYDEYIELRRRKKRNLKYLYLRKFNDRHPIYFPVK